MARAKKKTEKKPAPKGRHKKRVKKVQEPKGPQEWGGYRVGQEVWVMLPMSGTEEWGYGTITQLHPTDQTEPSFSFFDKVRKRYAIGALSRIAERPPKKWMSRV